MLQSVNPYAYLLASRRATEKRVHTLYRLESKHSRTLDFVGGDVFLRVWTYPRGRHRTRPVSVVTEHLAVRISNFPVEMPFRIAAALTTRDRSPDRSLDLRMQHLIGTRGRGCETTTTTAAEQKRIEEVSEDRGNFTTC